MIKTAFSSLLLAVLWVPLFAQLPAPLAVSDSFPLEREGLSMGYRILNEKEKEVGKKGEFSRYELEFFVTNNSAEAKMILYKQGLTITGNDPSPYLVQFNCLNATGARLTSKEALLQAKPCNLVAEVEDKDCAANKTILNKRLVRIGYWILAGETISNRAIVIVPLNEKPKMIATLLFKNNSLVASAAVSQPATTSYANKPLFYKIRNIANNHYINNEKGPINCIDINNKEAWSAQWEILPVPNSNFYLIKNRWKQIFLNNDASANFSTFNDQDISSMWMLEPVPNSNTYTLKNAANHSFLTCQADQVQMSAFINGQLSARWVMEPF